ncbi:DNA-directed RNA polymerase subunit beta [Olsenella sp. HMSC062G07]|uniref:DNA-directed RNA polymerase subunit beta n=1 Tax=Olsenella sp. HMSC062G07 TaxID=1739330 RepID=UPI0008A10E5C|nr:DNA-directed RNA polymerase subunit beta [Olsenella sp. HMSC062G07]OFK22685.1 DNA-directed RNA polymerase subunit beta [Olsenella sp. HMSC062G07]
MPTTKSSNAVPEKRERMSFSKIPAAMELPNLISVQKESYERFMGEGLAESFAEFSPIEDATKTMEVSFGDHMFSDPPESIASCVAKDFTYKAPLLVNVRFTNKATGEIKEQLVFMGDIPLMSDRGTFIIKGIERVVVSQLVRSPGVYFASELDNGVQVHRVQFIPARGAWLEFEVDKHGHLVVSIDRKRRQSATVLLRALGIAESDDDILNLLGDSEVVRSTVERDVATNRDDALLEIYRRQRPGEPPTRDNAASLLEGLYFNNQRYDLAKVGRYKINKKLALDIDPTCRVLTNEDVVSALQYLLALHEGDATKTVDDIDHFGNRRIRTVGELVQNQFRVGLTRMERVIRERMVSQDPDDITPNSLINIRPIDAAIKEFFGSSQLSQFMDQANPLSGLTHKRRLSALGPGGLAGHKSGSSRRTNVPTAVRDVHNSHYSRMCPIETPEGPNIGLIGSLALYAHVNDYGFIEAPYRKVEKGHVTDQIDWMTADEEENHVIAPATTPVDPKTGRFVRVNSAGKTVAANHVIARTKNFDGSFGAPAQVEVSEVDYMDVSPRQLLSVAANLIPFLEHDDAKRTLMGANMQRQAVPLIRSSAPLVGTGLERAAAQDSGELICASAAGVVSEVDAAHVVVTSDETGEQVRYDLPKFQRSNQSTCINHRPLVRKGQRVQKGEPLTDSASVDNGELALGANLTVAYVPWEGYNYEDGIVVSERVVQEDLLTSINISKYETEARDTKLGPEEITREIPNQSEEMLANLDDDGIIRIGAEVGPGDILVGKVTPKGETALTAEERLLRAIFGAKAHDVRDTSLRMPHGAYGRVVDVVHFSRDEGSKLSPGTNDQIRVFVAQRRKIQQGDKIAGRHGNKGVVCNVLPVEDMPYMADGTPVDILLDPLGVPSRMNVGQLMECHLGWAAAHGWDTESADSDRIVEGNMLVATPLFDGATDTEVEEALRRSNINLMNKARHEYGKHMREEFVPQLTKGKMTLYDGRTGEAFKSPITVGTSYILKLGHMVDDKIHARSTGPYSLVTQQPLGGKAQFGGQRFGEMEVWALYAYGASNVLHEMMTIKSDDTTGRVKTYESVVKGENVPAPGIPESFKVLVKEIRSLALDIKPIKYRDDVKPAVPADEPEQSAVEVLTDGLNDIVGDLTEGLALEDQAPDLIDTKE